jgi:hypothetical protein
MNAGFPGVLGQHCGCKAQGSMDRRVFFLADTVQRLMWKKRPGFARSFSEDRHKLGAAVEPR